MNLEDVRNEALQLDETDELKHLIAHFTLPGDCIYLDGNSLGPLPIAAKKRAFEVVEQQWGKDLITSWNKHSWINLPYTVGAKIAPLIGAAPEQVIVCDSISVNLTKVLSAALAIQQKNDKDPSNPKRHIVISQSENFPTDLYMVQGLSELVGQARCKLVTVAEDKIIQTINQYGDTAAILMLTHVNFRSGQILNMRKITEAAHNKGILVIWDLAHSAGALQIALDDCKVDFAVGCTYKYLNGGPGAPAFIYAAKRHWPHIKQPLSGWMGHKRPFEFTHDYEPGKGMAVFLAGTPPVVSLSILDAAMDVFKGISNLQIRVKSISLSQFFQDTFTCIIDTDKFSLASPSEQNQRGSQLAYSHPQAYAICQALISQSVIADFREPNILRIGFSPLFLTHTQLLEAIIRLKMVMDNKTYMQDEFQIRHAVT